MQRDEGALLQLGRECKYCILSHNYLMCNIAGFEHFSINSYMVHADITFSIYGYDRLYVMLIRIC